MKQTMQKSRKQLFEEEKKNLIAWVEQSKSNRDELVSYVSPLIILADTRIDNQTNEFIEEIEKVRTKFGTHHELEIELRKDIEKHWPSLTSKENAYVLPALKFKRSFGEFLNSLDEVKRFKLERAIRQHAVYNREFDRIAYATLSNNVLDSSFIKRLCINSNYEDCIGDSLITFSSENAISSDEFEVEYELLHSLSLVRNLWKAYENYLKDATMPVGGLKKFLQSVTAENSSKILENIPLKVSKNRFLITIALLRAAGMASAKSYNKSDLARLTHLLSGQNLTDGTLVAKIPDHHRIKQLDIEIDRLSKEHIEQIEKFEYPISYLTSGNCSNNDPVK